jgi:4-aminobutyrate aminotransferase
VQWIEKLPKNTCFLHPDQKLGRLFRKDERFVSSSYGRSYPLVIESASDCIVVDVDGNEYIDFNSGIACMNVGHNHPRVVQAVKSVRPVSSMFKC